MDSTFDFALVSAFNSGPFLSIDFNFEPVIVPLSATGFRLFFGSIFNSFFGASFEALEIVDGLLGTGTSPMDSADLDNGFEIDLDLDAELGVLALVANPVETVEAG